ncbi:MAG: DNA polymerase III subunit delta [Chitinophagaceae bacterium]|nr:DNA polymerase III subunit delta [Chitinophagaceae bacterium]
MKAEEIITDWKNRIFKPYYWLEGEESYFIDKVVEYAEKNILSDTEAAFNLTIFYGKDARWQDVLQACRRYPAFAERQVVIIKEAQQMRDLEMLEPYFEQPMPSTVLVISYKEKKLDARKKIARLIKQNGVLFTTRKLYERELPEWTLHMVKAKGLQIRPKALELMIDHVGNDLSRIENEIEKLSLNISKKKVITEDDIEEFIGVSKEFNVFELQKALAAKDLHQCLRIIRYFESNPKSAPIQLILPSLYNFFSKVYAVYGLPSAEKKSVAEALGVHIFFAEDYIRAARIYSMQSVENVLLLLHQYNLKSIGIDQASTEDASLMKELVVKIIYQN